jgi:hypothetical protein
MLPFVDAAMAFNLSPRVSANEASQPLIGYTNISFRTNLFVANQVASQPDNRLWTPWPLIEVLSLAPPSKIPPKQHTAFLNTKLLCRHPADEIHATTYLQRCDNRTEQSTRSTRYPFALVHHSFLLTVRDIMFKSCGNSVTGLSMIQKRPKSYSYISL